MCISREWLGEFSLNLELEVPHPEGIHTEISCASVQGVLSYRCMKMTFSLLWVTHLSVTRHTLYAECHAVTLYTHLSVTHPEFLGLHNTLLCVLINNEGVISNFVHKAKLNFCHAYRINRFEEQTDSFN